MVVYSKGFTKYAFSNHEVKFFDGLRSITGEPRDADLLRFLAAVFSSRLFRYIAFHGGSNFGVGRDQFHVYESLSLPFPLPDSEFASSHAQEIVKEAAQLIKRLEHTGKTADAITRASAVREVTKALGPLVDAYFSVSESERILINDTLGLFQPSIHRHSFDGDVPALAFPDRPDRKRYADTLCDVLSRHARKDGIKISVEGRVSMGLNLVFMTVIFGRERKPYNEVAGDSELWQALDRVSKAAQYDSRPFSYLRGFTYLESDRLHMLKPATMRNWCRTAALNDADEIFEHLVGQEA
jgi:hypothetical protein